MGLVRWRGWGLALAVLAALGGLLVAGRLLELPQDRQALTRPPPSTAPSQVVSVTTRPTAVPRMLWRPLRLPSLGPDGSCPTTPAVGPPLTRAHPVAAVAVGAGPVYPVLFRAGSDGRLDQSAVAYWDAPEPLGGVVIVRGHRLGAPRDQIRFLDDGREPSLVHVLDPAAAYPAAGQGRWWRPTRLRAGAGCYGLQIDGLRFSKVLVVELR
jgi:hypothetical protein